MFKSVPYAGGMEGLTANVSVRKSGSACALGKKLHRDEAGAVLIESAFVIPIIIILMLAVLTYATWFMQAHSIQQVTNDAARSSLAGLTDEEREFLVNRSIDASLLDENAISRDDVEVTTETEDGYYTVTLSYNVASHAILRTAFVPLPSDTISRSATVEIPPY